MLGTKKKRPAPPRFSGVLSYMDIMLGTFMPEGFPEFMDSLRESEQAATGTEGVDMGMFEPTVLDFDGQPDCFFPGEGAIPYRGQEPAKKRLSLYIRALQRGQRLKALYTGPAGTGKTTLARIVAARLQQRQAELGLPVGEYYELLPSQVETKAQLDAFMQRVTQDPTAIVFIDEVHTLSNLESMFHVLHDTGALRYPLSNGGWLEVSPMISWLAATTDPGELDKTVGGAMRRRLEPEIRLEAPGPEVLADIVKDQGEADGMPVIPVAAGEMAERSLFPWQVKLIYGEAKKVALVEGSEEIALDHAREAFSIMEIDQRGLLREDREVIAQLLRAPYQLATRPGVTRYRMSEEALCSAAGVDRHTYKKRIQPKLLRLGYLTTVGGQSLTEKALTDYGWLSNGRGSTNG